LKRENKMTECVECGSKMIWNSDESSNNDLFIDSFYSCSECETTAVFTRKVKISYSKKYCLEVIRKVIDPDSELYEDIEYYIGE